ncbi:MAG: ABC transporter ATP-binding protein [Bacteroidetes bacterium]|nr:ABC transporter ATP-binding protein [Bacteroidota bacterium]
MQDLLALNHYFRRYSGAMWAGIVCIVLSNIAGVYVPVFVRQGIDDSVYLVQMAGDLGHNQLAGTIFTGALWFGLLVVAASAVKGVFMYLMRQYIVVVSRKVEYDLKNDIYAHYQKLSTGFYRRNYTGDMMARIGEDVSNVRMYVGPAIMYFVNIIFTFITVVFQMLRTSPSMTLWVLLPLPVLSYSIYVVSKIINRRNTAIQTQLSTLTTQAQETFAGIRVIKSFGAGKWFNLHFNQAGKEYHRLNMRLALVNSLFFPLMMLLVGLSMLIVLYLGGIQAAHGRFTTGNIAEFVIYLNMLIWPVASLGWTTALVQKAAASQKRINEFLDTEKEPVHTGTAPFTFEQSIQFSNVNFTYPGSSKPALDGISIELKKGKILGITGRTGSGKSTIAQLLMRQYEAGSGKILIDGKPLQEMDMYDFRRHVSYIPQDVFLFSETIAENIAFGLEEGTATRGQILAAATAAGLTRDIDAMPQGLDTMLGERGVTLSGGQKQRVSIARALIRQAGLYVFDDCLSAVDARTEQEIIRHFVQSLHGKTAIIISHRLAPLAFADEILVVQNGRIAEQGTHQDLLAAGGEYANLYKMQMHENTAAVPAE